jgi:multiple sugar transport system permease protein
MLKPVIIATTVLQAISLANNPDLLVVLTGGGPGNTTQVLSLYAFNLAYREFNFGYAATVAVIIFMALLSFTLVYVRASGTFKDDA